MKEPSPLTLRVRDWDRLYENNRSRRMINTHWFPMPNDLSADSYVELMAHLEGTAHLGVWTGILMVDFDRVVLDVLPPQPSNLPNPAVTH
jgi:hypothetical protein